jgi:hypothetical protein
MIFTTSSFTSREMPDRCGDDCYSYFFVQRAFLPLLERHGDVAEVDQPQTRLDEAVADARRRRLAPLHLSFLPPQYMPLASDAPNVAFPFWEYPDVPDYDVAGKPENNWARMANRLDLLVTACDFTRDAFRRAGVTTPAHVVPVPVADDYFQLADWQPGERTALDCACYLLPAAGRSAARVAGRRAAARAVVTGARDRLRGVYHRRVRPRLPAVLHRGLAHSTRRVAGQPVALPSDPFPLPYAASDRLELSGIIYTSILNPFDIRKNWRGLVEGFLRGLRDQADAMLVVKLAVSRTMRQEALHNLLTFYQRLGLRHRCRLAIVADYLSDEQMLRLTAASAYYVNTSTAEGACLPLQDYLAAGRPGIAPAHTAMAEYLDDKLAVLIDSHPEPTYWPWDPERRITTSWHKLEVDEIAARLRSSHELIVRDRQRYRDMAATGRERMRGFASAAAVWPRLAAALADAHERAGASREVQRRAG